MSRFELQTTGINKIHVVASFKLNSKKSYLVRLLYEFDLVRRRKGSNLRTEPCEQIKATVITSCTDLVLWGRTNNSLNWLKTTLTFTRRCPTLLSFHTNIVFQTKTGYSIFSADFRLKISLRKFLGYRSIVFP